MVATNLATEIWISPEDKDFFVRALQNGNLLLTPRLGNRLASTTSAKGGYAEGAEVRLRVHVGDGLFDAWEQTVRVTSVRLRLLSTVREEEFCKMPPSQRTPEAVRSFLARVYRSDIPKDATITLVGLRSPHAIEEVKT
jgi:hypothetical protein